MFPKWEHFLRLKEMKLIGKGVLDEFKKSHADVHSQVDSWVAEVEAANWNMPLDIKRRYPKASILANNEVIFDLKGNKYRLLIKVNYEYKVVLVKNAGTHDEYIKW